MMKVVIFAGGMGTRFHPLTKKIPKPMITVAGKPIIERIMDHYARYGFTNFVVLGGFKYDAIRNYFTDFNKYNVEVIDTGLETMTGGRLKYLNGLIDGDFFLTYGDGLCDVNILELLEFHKHHQKILTLTSVRPISKYGLLEFEGDKITSFSEKSQTSNWINGGFFVCKKSILNYVDSSETIFESGVISKLLALNEVTGFKFDGFWRSMDDKNEKIELDKLYSKDI